MKRRVFILLIGLSLIPAAYVAYSLIDASESDSSQGVVQDFEFLPKQFFGIPIPEGMDAKTFAKIMDKVDQAIDEAMPKCAALIGPRIEARWEELKAQGLSKEEVKRRVREEGLIKEFGLCVHESEMAKFRQLLEEWERERLH